MSVPDNSRPKAPPSLLADAPGKPAGAPASGTPNGSRILANLEGRVVPPIPPAGRTQRFPKAAGFVALLVIGAGAFGAWHWMSRTPSNASGVAATAASAVTVTAASAAPASHAVVAGAQKSAPDEASASHAATIVADDDAANTKAGTVNDSDRLSRALADGSASGAPAAPAAPAAAPQAKAVQAVQTPDRSTAKYKHDSADTKQEKRDKSSAHKSESKAALAQSKNAHANGKRDDSDVDLLAVLVARTKPADAKQGGTHGSKASAKATDGSASLAQQVKACSERGFFEDQLCRWRVCDGHWGNDPACPQAAKSSSEH